ncbi:MAG: hypothetical protein QGF74_01965 [Candidatus Nanoarchaeia archaeon]|jgi:hypothetical protein|nr:hypothetical protein [Candidatus Nanoarchaeia archaeon]|tara:strand:+ start:39370 stop:39510 length:141 start_codon:yes stop_codon:yes gene_type:complete
MVEYCCIEGCERNPEYSIRWEELRIVMDSPVYQELVKTGELRVREE